MANSNPGPSITTQTPTQPSSGNIVGEYIVAQALTAASVGAATVAEQSFTLTGILVGDQVSVTKATFQAGLAMGPVRVTAANTIGISFINPTAGAIVPTAGDIYTFNVVRPQTQSLANGLPIAILNPLS